MHGHGAGIISPKVDIGAVSPVTKGLSAARAKGCLAKAGPRPEWQAARARGWGGAGEDQTGVLQEQRGRVAENGLGSGKTPPLPSQFAG